MRNLILGTDWGADCDDCVALRVAARLAKQGKINLIAIGINCCKENSYASMIAFLNKEGISVPVGLDTREHDFDWRESYQLGLASLRPDLSNCNADSAVRVYRRAIANADGPVEIMEIGFLQVLADLLRSPADDISPKTGLELVKERVTKIWSMAGRWSQDGGLEFNFQQTSLSREGGAYVCEHCPVPITFLGWEIGASVITGTRLDKNDYLHKALCAYGTDKGRPSWDPMLVLMACIGDERKAGYAYVTGFARLDPESGRNYFTNDENGRHRYVIKCHRDSYYANKIDEIIKS